MATYVSTKGNLINDKGTVVGKAAPGTTGTFSEGVAPGSSAGSAQSTARATSSSNPHDAPGYNPANDPTSSVNMKGAAPTTPLATPINTATGAPATAIDTNQPNPATVQVTPPTQASPEQVAQVAQATQQVNDLASRYKTGLASVQGQPAPASQGQAMGAVNQALPGAQQEAPSVVGEIMETDSNFDSILTMYDEFMSPQVQRTSLLEEYQQMSKALGIEGMNAELINSKRIIEGTEDDIRSEIAAVGGVGTESQVLALANARNKSLIKNYNYLRESRDSAMTQLNTMMNLSMQDRQMAEAEFDRKMGFAFKVAEFKERAINNAKDNYNNIVKSVGYAGLLAATNGNAYEQSLIEKTLGIGTGGLTKLASIVNEEQDLNLQLKREQILTERAQRGKIYADTQKTEADAAALAAPAAGAEERIQGVISIAQELLKSDAVGKKSAVGASLAKLVPGGKSLGLQPNRSAFEAKVDTLKANLTLDNLKLLKGAMSDKDLAFLQSVGSSLDVNMSEKEFNKELEKVITKLGGSNESTPLVVPQSQIPAGYYQASDGKFYKQ